MGKSSLEWRIQNKERLKEYNKEWRKKNTERIRAYNAQYRADNPDKIKKLNKKWNSDPSQRDKRYKNMLERLKTDPAFRACEQARKRARYFLKKEKVSFSKKLGCSQKQFKNHIESQFAPGMSWENYGKWHLDHVYPLSKAIKEGPETFSMACNYKNIRPLWAEENRKKSNKCLA